MSAPTPSMGRIVHYALSDREATAINKRRDDFAKHLQSQGYADTGYIAHYGNQVREGDVFPAVIVRVWPHPDPTHTSTNLKVLLDGADDYWATSRTEGEGPGHWSWPPRV